jgi:hypothetical protein
LENQIKIGELKYFLKFLQKEEMFVTEKCHFKEQNGRYGPLDSGRCS